jgi:hypothetical protein
VERRDGPERLSHLLTPGGDGLGRLVRHADLLARASALVAGRLPPPLGDHCRVADVEGGTVVVQADSAAWAARLRFMTPAVRDALAPLLAGSVVKQVKVTVASPRPPTAAQPTGRRPPLTAESALLLERAAEAVTDPALQDALRRLSRRGPPQG